MLSIVAPCFNENEVLDSFYVRVKRAAENLGLTFEIVLVNDGSTDASWKTINELARADERVVGVNLARNFGQEKALAAGLAFCEGDYVLILDADLQDPPELLPKMFEMIHAGADVVYGQRAVRRGESWFKRMSAEFFYCVLSFLTDVPIPRNTGNFRLIRRRVVDVVVSMQEQDPYMRGMLSWVGFRQVPISFDREPRAAGISKWPTRRMVRLATDAIVANSMTPLRLSGWLSVLSFVVAVVAAIAAVYAWESDSQLVSVLVTSSIVSAGTSMQLVIMYVMGEYLGRLSRQASGRPMFVIESITRVERDYTEREVQTLGCYYRCHTTK